MEDNKNMKNNENVENSENIVNSQGSEDTASIEKIESALIDEALSEELEGLAELFRRELAKTTEEFANRPEEEPEEADEEVLICEICGEVYENGKDGICENCLNELRNTPFKFTKIICIILAGALSIVAMRGFWKNTEGYALAHEAKTQFKEGNLTSAKKAYDEALSYYENNDDSSDSFLEDTVKNLTGENGIPRKLYFESAEVVFVEMSEGSASMNEVALLVSKGFEDSVLPMPQYAKYKKMGNESRQLYVTMQAFYDIVNKDEYQQYTAADTEMYQSIMKELEGLLSLTVEIETVDGEVKEMPYNVAMVRFCQYMFAYTSGNSADSQKYLKMIYEAGPEYLWLYAYEYAIASIKSDDVETAENLAEALVELNREDPDGYRLYSTIARVSGEYDKAVLWADKALAINPGNAETLRIKALALAAKGDYDEAKKVVDEAKAYETYGVLLYTSVVIEKELGNTQTVEETLSLLNMYGLGASEMMNKYLAGEITAEELLTQKGGDVE